MILTQTSQVNISDRGYSEPDFLCAAQPRTKNLVLYFTAASRSNEPVDSLSAKNICKLLVKLDSDSGLAIGSSANLNVFW